MSANDHTEARAALLEALTSGRVEIVAIGDRLRRFLKSDDDPAESRQFLQGLESLVVEGLRGEERTLRDLVFDTAVPALVREGRTADDLLTGHVTLFVAITHDLVDAVAGAVRDDALLWLATFFAEYTREVVERARAAEGRAAG